MKRRLIVLALAALGLLLASCSFVRIQNVSDRNVTVLVTTPDSSQVYTRTIRSGAIVDVFSGHGGTYTITQINSEFYRATLERLQATITTRLFEEGATLTPDEVARLTQNLNEIDQLLEQSTEPLGSCSGYLPDFDTVVVTVGFDMVNSQYELSCSSGEG